VINMKKANTLKSLFSKYKHGLILSYFFIYITWFGYLEKTITTHYHVIHSRLDDFIPFNEIFIIPYFIWFIYIFVTVAYFLLTSKKDFYKCCAYLFSGMTICLFIYTIFPNGHHLRVDLNSLGRSNIFIDMLSKIYTVDTATNVFPSIHVFNSIGAFIAISRSERLKKITWLKWGSLVLTFSICLSTVLLKQHSILDVFGAIALNTLLYFIIYVPFWAKFPKRAEQKLSNI